VASSSPNTRADQDNSNDTLRNTFRARRGGPVTFKIRTDDYPLETSLAIYNPITNDTFLRINAGDLTGTRTTYTYSLCMSDICYRLKIYDGGNDGICCSFGNGYYTIYNGPDTLLTNVPFTNNLTQNFCNYQLPDMDIAASDLSICAGDNVLLTANEDNNTSRQWSITGPGLTLLDTSLSINPTLNNPGTYEVILRGFNAYGLDSSIVSITVNELPTATYTVVNATTPTNGSITANITSGATPISHLWSNGMSGNPLSGLAPGTYYDTIVDANGCINIYSAIVQNSVGIDDIKNINELNVYPNPFTNEILVTLFNISKIENYRLVNSLGENIDIKTQLVDNNTVKISVPAVSNGIYYLIAKDAELIYKSKLIKH
jgi:hypothetical protein